MSVYDSREFEAMITAIKAAPDGDLPRLIAADFLEENNQPERAEFIRCQVWAAELERNSGGRLPVKVFENASYGTSTPSRMQSLHYPRKRNELNQRILELATNEKPKFEPGDIVEIKNDIRGQVYGESIEGDWVAKWVGVPLNSQWLWYSELVRAPACETRDRWRALKARGKELLEENRSEWLKDSPLQMDAWSLDEPMQDYVYGARCRFVRGFVELLTIRAADWDAHGTEIMRRNPVRSVVITGAAQPMGIVHHIDGNANNNDPANLYHGRR